MFEFVMVLCFAYAGFCFLLPGTAERRVGGNEGKRKGGAGKECEASRHPGPRGRHCRNRNAKGPKRLAMSRTG
jgi:hypothetical protein